MRIARIKAENEGFYHVISRLIERRKLFGPKEQAVFRTLLRQSEAFCGVKVLTYAILSSHFHLLVHVPERQELTDHEFLERLAIRFFSRRGAEAQRGGQHGEPIGPPGIAPFVFRPQRPYPVSCRAVLNHRSTIFSAPLRLCASDLLLRFQPRRHSGARPIRYSASPLYTLRNLRLQPVTMP